MASEQDTPSDSQRPRKKRPPARRNREWTDRETAWFRFGGTLAVLGVLGVFAPLVGLKFKGAKEEQQVAVAIGLIVLGGLTSLITFLRHGGLAEMSPQSKRRIIYWVGGGTILTVMMCGGLVIFAKMREKRFAQVPPPGMGGGQPVAPAFPVQITLKNIKNLDLNPLRSRLQSMSSRPEIPVGMPPFVGVDEITVILHFAGSPEELASKINFGTAQVTNSRARTMAVTVDRSQFSERNKR